MKKENWSIGKIGGTVITDCDDGFEDTTGHKDPTKEYYGGTLIAESIWRKKDVKLIAAAPDLLECLQEAIESMELETSNVPQNWIDAIKKAIDE